MAKSFIPFVARNNSFLSVFISTSLLFPIARFISKHYFYKHTPEAYDIKLCTAVVYKCAKKATAFVHGKHIQLNVLPVALKGASLG
jgi:hypothetical protein